MSKKANTTMSDEYDKKLKSDLYEKMLTLQKSLGDLKECEDNDDEEEGASIVMFIIALCPSLVESYFKCIEGQKDV